MEKKDRIGKVLKDEREKGYRIYVGDADKDILLFLFFGDSAMVKGLCRKQTAALSALNGNGTNCKKIRQDLQQMKR